MKKIKTTKNREKDIEGRPHRVRLPGFIIEEEVGLGDVVQRIAYSMGLKPCGGCRTRGSALNRWMRFSR